MRRISILPLTCYAVLLGYAAYAASVIGHWPYYANPDPKELPLRGLLGVVSAFMILGILSVLLLPVGYSVWRTMAAEQKRPVTPHGLWVVLFCAGATLWIIDFLPIHSDVAWTSMMDWLLD